MVGFRRSLGAWGCTPKVVYGESGTRLEMYKGAQVRAWGPGPGQSRARASGCLGRVSALPGRSGCTPKVVYGESGMRLEMYKGAQVRALGSGARTVQG